MTVEAKNRMAVVAVLSSLSYSFCSVSMVMSNKALAFNYRSNLTFLVVVMQCVVGTVLVEIGRRLGYASYDPFNLATAKRWLPVSLCFSAMLFTSFKALEIMNVPMVTVFKNLTNIVIVAGDWWFFHQAASWAVIASMAVMVFGALVASYHDLHFIAWGYFWMVANCCSTAGYVLYMKFATKTIKLPRFGMVFYNNLLTSCLLIPAAFFVGDFGIFFSTPQLHTMTYTTINLFAGVVGVMLNFASLWCVGATSATTYAVVGSVNVIPTALLGFWLFESPISPQMGKFMIVSMAGGFLYSYAKLQEKWAMERARKLEGENSSQVKQNGDISAAEKPLLEVALGEQAPEHSA